MQSPNPNEKGPKSLRKSLIVHTAPILLCYGGTGSGSGYSTTRILGELNRHHVAALCALIVGFVQMVLTTSKSYAILLMSHRVQPLAVAEPSGIHGRNAQIYCIEIAKTKPEATTA